MKIAKKNQKKRIFLDYASTTPALHEVEKAMRPFFATSFANPSALYEEGVNARKIVEKSRKEVARILSAHSDEIIFTGSGTESDNLALFGTVKTLRLKIPKPHIITSSFEHPAILEAAKQLEKEGVEVTYISPDKNGFITPSEIKKELKSNTVLVSVMFANNEIGTVQNIREIAKTIRLFRKEKKKDKDFPYLHTDASQAANYFSLNVLELHTDLLTLDGSKIYGPKGIGMLFVRRGVKITPQIVGGGQEKGFRSGTENVPLIVGFTKAFSIVQSDREKESKRLNILRDFVIKKILKEHPKAKLNGSFTSRLPNNINICFPGIDAEFAVIKLDSLGFACSSSSSCRTLSENSSSYVIESIGGGEECRESSLRFSLGRGNVKKDLIALCKILKKILP